MEQNEVTNYIKNLHTKYSVQDLCSLPGDNQLRHEIFAPLFYNLYQKNKVVYKERFSCILTLENIIITPERFEAVAVPIALIKGGSRSDKYFSIERKWEFGAVWSHIRLLGTHINSLWANWSIWCDPKTVMIIENLVLNNQMEEALDIIFNDQVI